MYYKTKKHKCWFTNLTARLAQWLSDRLLRCLSRVRFPHGINIYMAYTQVVVPGLAVCVCGFYVCKRTRNIGIILSVGYLKKKKKVKFRRIWWSYSNQGDVIEVRFYVLCSGLFVYVISMFVNAPTIQEPFLA